MRFYVLLIVSLLAGWECSAGGETVDAPIDAILERTHRRAGLQPSPPCDDVLFLRRATLDLVGRVPTLAELRAFQVEPNRSKLIDRLLATPEFDRYWSILWTDALIGRGPSRQTDREALRRWLEEAFSQRRPLDQIAFDLIAAQGVTSLDGAVNFLLANREDPVTPVSRTFLGVQLDCARCHDHPFDRWSQNDYLAMKRFFSLMQLREVSGGVRLLDTGNATDQPDQTPRFLTGAQPRTSAWRTELALMTVRCQPFARAMGNRTWQWLIGRGVVDPVDALSHDNPPAVPELHQALADQLRGQHFSLRRLVRTICLSDAYRRSDFATAIKNQNAGEAAEHYKQFASRAPRPLLPEQLVRSYHTVTERDQPPPPRLHELAVNFFGQASVSSGAADPFDVPRGSQGLLHELALPVNAPTRDLDDLFQITLARLPDESERRRFGDLPADDVFYALLHCNEFVFSH